MPLPSPSPSAPIPHHHPPNPLTHPRRTIHNANENATAYFESPVQLSRRSRGLVTGQDRSKSTPRTRVRHGRRTRAVALSVARKRLLGSYTHARVGHEGRG